MIESKKANAPEAVDLTGHCYCGGIRFRVKMPIEERPIFTVYCHCDGCRRAHAAPLYQTICIDEQCFEITQGEQLLEEFQKPGGTIVRAFCRQCGTRILNSFDPKWKPGGKTPLAFFPNLLEKGTAQALPAKLLPEKNYRPEDCVLERQVIEELFPPHPS